MEEGARLTHGFRPRRWQEEALRVWARDRRGVVQVVTGAGKTAFAMMCVAEFLSAKSENRALVVVPTIALLDQWYLDAQESLEIDRSEIGLLGGSERPESSKSRLVIAVINSARTFSASFSREGQTMLVVDECHRAGSPENARAMNGDYVATLGLSATPERDYDEGFEEHVVPVLGGVVFEYTYADAAKDGLIVPFALANIRIDLLPDERSEYERLTRLVRIRFSDSGVESGDTDYQLRRLLQRRAAVSANAVMRIPASVHLAELHRKERVIIFHERIDAADCILSSLLARGHRATIYHTGIGAEMRRENLRLFRKGIFDVMVCCRALDEGLNVPSASVAVIASSTASTRQRIQRLGRILRAAPGKKNAIVYTIFATEAECGRLQDEERSLEGVALVSWREVKTRPDA